MKQGYVLVVVLLVMFIGILMVGLTTALLFTTGQQQTMGENRNGLRYAADSAVEDTILLLLRRPTYQGFSTVEMQSVQVEVAVSLISTNSAQITAVATGSGQMHRSQAVVQRNQGMLEVVSWERN